MYSASRRGRRDVSTATSSTDRVPVTTGRSGSGSPWWSGSRDGSCITRMLAGLSGYRTHVRPTFWGVRGASHPFVDHALDRLSGILAGVDGILQREIQLAPLDDLERVGRLAEQLSDGGARHAVR